MNVSINPLVGDHVHFDDSDPPQNAEESPQFWTLSNLLLGN